MNSINDIISTIRHLDLEKIRGLRPNYPPVAIEINQREMVLVRLKRRRGKTYLEAHQARALPEATVGTSIIRPNLGSPDTVVKKVQDLFAASGTRPGKVSLVLPDNLAKVTLMTLPERPGSRKQLTELIRFRLRRAVPGSANWSAAVPASISMLNSTSGVAWRSARTSVMPLLSSARCTSTRRCRARSSRR